MGGLWPCGPSVSIVSVTGSDRPISVSSARKNPVGVGHPGEPIGQRLGVEAEVRAQAELHSLPEGQLPADRVAVLGPAGGVGEPDTDRWQFDVFTGSGR
jgi:hypothetical protein